MGKLKLENLAAQDREVLLGVLAQYTAMKRQIAERERTEIKLKKPKGRER